MKTSLRIALLMFVFTLKYLHVAAQIPPPPPKILPDTAALNWKGKVKKKTRHGEWEATDANGNVKIIATYNRGVPEGKWQSYYSNGLLYEQGVYAQGKRTGVWNGYTVKGDSLYSISWENGVLHGPFRQFSARGRLQSSGQYVHGKKEGRWEYHHGSLNSSDYSVDHYLHDTLHGLHQRFANGKVVEEIVMVKGKREGTHTTYWESGRVKRIITFKNDTANGPCVDYGKRGDTLEYGQFSRGVKAGYWEKRREGVVIQREWFSAPLEVKLNNGYKRERDALPRLGFFAKPDSSYHYINGKLQRKEIYRDTTDIILLQGGIKDVTEYYETGIVKCAFTMNRNHVLGTVRYYDANGRLFAVLNKNGMVWEGPAVWYHNNGALRAKDTLHNGMLSDNVSLYDRRGKIIPVNSPQYKKMEDSLYVLTPGLTKWTQEEEPLMDASEYGAEVIEEVGPPNKYIDEASEKDQVYMFAEEMPTFPGGEAEFQKYLMTNLVYPQAEKDAGVSGTVYMYFEVAKDGSILNVRTMKGVPGHPALETEAKRVLAAMPKWIPGKMNGKPVVVGMTVPVRFLPQ